MSQSRYARLLAVPLVLSLIDVFVTLLYQPAAYWSGDRSALVEGNPTVWAALRIHPLLMIPGIAGWYGCVGLLMFRTPSWIGLRVYVVVVFGHLVGIGGWLIRHHQHGVLLTCLIALVGIGFATWMFMPFRSQWNGKKPVSL